MNVPDFYFKMNSPIFSPLHLNPVRGGQVQAAGAGLCPAGRPGCVWEVVGLWTGTPHPDTHTPHRAGAAGKASAGSSSPASLQALQKAACVRTALPSAALTSPAPAWRAPTLSLSYMCSRSHVCLVFWNLQLACFWAHLGKPSHTSGVGETRGRCAWDHPGHRRAPICLFSELGPFQGRSSGLDTAGQKALCPPRDTYPQR